MTPCGMKGTTTVNTLSQQHLATPSEHARALLSAALDPTGYICIVGLKTKAGAPPVQTFFKPGAYQNAIAEAMRLSGIGYDAYFGTSTYATPDNRTAANVHVCKVFKLDLDVCADALDKKYASKKDAVASLIDFCAETGLPMPVLVDSGGGVHCYWIMAEALTPDEGRLYSEKLKAITIGHSMKTDITITADIARILRVPDTLNYKKAVARPVVLRSEVDVHDTDMLLDLIDAAYTTVGAPVAVPEMPSMLGGMAVPAHLRNVQLDDTTRSLLTGKPKSFAVLVDRCMTGTGCNQMRDIYERQAEQDEPRWHAGLSIAWFCTDGEEAVHTLSNQHPEYDPNATIVKAQRAPGPRTCDWFQSNYPKLCEGCQHRGKVASPIVLGIVDGAPVTNASGTTHDDAAVIAQLAALSKADYDRARTKAAKELGVRTATLDEMVAAARAARQEASNLPFVDVEPWDDAVDVAALLDEISETVRRYIVCEKEVADAAALWAAMTWVVDALQIAPLAVVTAPEKRCGKSELRRLMAKFVHRPLEADGMSASVLFRGFDLWKPTLLVDEYDTFVQDDEDLRGIFNAGHQRGGCIWRCIGEDHEPKRFEVFGPKLLAGIGKLPGTMMDRAIIFELRRKLAHERVERLRYADSAAFDVLRRKLARFGQDHIETVRAARPSLPDALNDRQQDNWESLLAIADIAGRGWSEPARAAALKLSAGKEDAISMATELLADIREIFAEKKMNAIFSYQLVYALCRDERRWCTHNRGGNITAAQVARILKGYGIGPKSMRIDLENAKGYAKEQFTDAWERYLPPTP
jgi:hypothetical protein